MLSDGRRCQRGCRNVGLGEGLTSRLQPFQLLYWARAHGDCLIGRRTITALWHVDTAIVTWVDGAKKDHLWKQRILRHSLVEVRSLLRRFEVKRSTRLKSEKSNGYIDGFLLCTKGVCECIFFFIIATLGCTLV